MKTLRHLFIFIAVCGSALLKGQDMHFTQFYSTPLYLNPAFAGADVCSRVGLTYRNQWPGINRTYRSYAVSADHFFMQNNMGAGVFIASDVAGSGDLKTTMVHILVAYEGKLSKKLYVRMGVQPGFVMRSINYNKLTFGDQIARGGGVATIEEPLQQKGFFDIASGILFYNKKSWGGFAAHHLNRPNQSFMENDGGVVPIKISFHGGHKRLINQEEKNEVSRKYVTGVFNYRHQNKFDQLDIGFYFTQNILNVGLWYRGIPLFKHYAPGYSNNDAVALILGVQNARFNFGYSYDMTISRLSALSRGAHELTISYQLCKLKKKKKVRMLLPCPKF